MTCIHHYRQPGNSVIFGLGSLSCGLCALLYQALLFSQTRGHWCWTCGWGESPGVHVDRRLRNRTCVISSESDGNDLMVQNALSLGAPGMNIVIHFYSSTFYTNSFVGGEKCLIWRDYRGNLLVVLSLLPLIVSCPSIRVHKMCGVQDGNEMADFF